MERLAGRVILLWGWPRRIAALFAGALASLALAPFDFPAACFVAFPILVWLLDGGPAIGGLVNRLLPAFSAGWWFGFGYFLAGLWWVGTGFAGDQPAWAAIAAAIGIPAAFALFYGFATLAARFLWSDGVGRIAALAFGFGFAEWLRSTLLPGMAWNAIGYAAMPVPLLMQAAHIAGIFGISSIAVFVFSAPALLGTRLHARAGLAIAAALVAAQAGYGYYRLAMTPVAGDALEVRIVQPAADSRTPFEEVFRSYLELSASPSTDGRPRPHLIIWPERAIPFVLSDRPDLLEAVVGMLGEDQLLVTGTIRAEDGAETDERRLYNSLVAITGAQGIVDAVDQAPSLPFPPDAAAGPWRPDFRPLSLVNALFAGDRSGILAVSKNVGLLPLMGTEAIAPVTLRNGGAQLILSVADHAELAGTTAPHQFLRQVQLRAVETGLPLLIATPNGISAVISPRGQIVDALAAGAYGVIGAAISPQTFQMPELGNITLHGLTFSLIFLMFALLLIIRVSTSSRCD
jgi:apolipoprotein N-acyltransferase